jgi:hypothetical protein
VESTYIAPPLFRTETGGSTVIRIALRFTLKGFLESTAYFTCAIRLAAVDAMLSCGSSVCDGYWHARCEERAERVKTQ